MTTVKVPASIDLSDKVLFGLTARQVGILAPVAAALIVLWQSLDDFVAAPILLLVLAPIAAVALALALGRRDGTSLDRLAWAALGHPRQPLAPGRLDQAAAVCLNKGAGGGVGTLNGPVEAVGDDGVMDLGSRGVGIGLDASCVNFSLRSDTEQAMLTGGFARLLHSISAPLQIVVSVRQASVNDHLVRVRRAARALPQSALRDAAREYVSWLTDVTEESILLRREVTIVTRAPDVETVQRQAAHIAEACAGFGVACRRLDRDELAARIRVAVDPHTASPHGGTR